jgi:hypothetical protein
VGVTFLQDRELGNRSKYPDFAIKVGVSASVNPGDREDPRYALAFRRLRDVFVDE